MFDKPCLRPLDFQPVEFQGQPMWLLRDPLELTDYQLILPPALAQMLIFCDGTHTPQEIQVAFSRHAGVPIDFSIVQDTLAALDEACLLDNERAAQARQAHLATYRHQPHRPPALAGLSYPADPGELAGHLADFGRQDNLNGWQPWQGRAVISPHIDYLRGGPVYAQVWRRAEAAVKEAELILVFGTDHNGGFGRITLTRQPYATPFGVLPADVKLVERLAEALGPDEAFAEELHHRKEHSVELSAVWLHYVRGQQPCPVVPILCGSFQHFVSNGHHPADDPKLNAFVETLRAETAGKRVLAVASVDLAHVGPNFGDDFLMDGERRVSLAESDERLMAAISAGDAAQFYEEIASVQDCHRICGFSSIYLMLRYLGPGQGIRVAYEQCPADPQDTSLVSICGLLLA
ncbi:MAG: AmmeMemoRadiSam system protein B [Chloroflexi bacterium]|nr:AmmeMemoRadiSam system protein B [Chloroflexota bacterium]